MSFVEDTRRPLGHQSTAGLVVYEYLQHTVLETIMTDTDVAEKSSNVGSNKGTEVPKGNNAASSTAFAAHMQIILLEDGGTGYASTGDHSSKVNTYIVSKEREEEAERDKTHSTLEGGIHDNRSSRKPHGQFKVLANA